MKNRSLFSGFRKDLAARYGEEAANQIWRNAEAKAQQLADAHTQFRGDGKNMIDVAAIYLALREHDEANALPVLLESGKRLGMRLGRLVHGITSIPGVPELLWRHMPTLMRDMSSEKKGYTSRLVNDSGSVIGVDILTCPIHQAAIEMGVPEAAKIVCAMDKEYMTGFRRIDYTRTQSVAEGAECCDYRLAYNPDKP